MRKINNFRKKTKPNLVHMICILCTFNFFFFLNGHNINRNIMDFWAYVISIQFGSRFHGPWFRLDAQNQFFFVILFCHYRSSWSFDLESQSLPTLLLLTSSSSSFSAPPGIFSSSSSSTSPYCFPISVSRVHFISYSSSCFQRWNFSFHKFQLYSHSGMFCYVLQHALNFNFPCGFCLF